MNGSDSSEKSIKIFVGLQFDKWKKGLSMRFD